jgi:hypothetical protein
MRTPPTIDDIAPPPTLYGPLATFLAWNRLPARIVVGALAYHFFCPLIDFVNYVVTEQHLNDDDIAVLVGTFLPGISIVLGTYFTLTLSILYERFSRMQETISLEASLLALLFTHIVELFETETRNRQHDENNNDDDDTATDDTMVEGVQCIADQIATLVRESRGRETMRLMYNDPYTRILNLIKQERSRRQGNLDSVS